MVPCMRPRLHRYYVYRSPQVTCACCNPKPRFRLPTLSQALSVHKASKVIVGTPTKTNYADKPIRHPTPKQHISPAFHHSNNSRCLREGMSIYPGRIVLWEAEELEFGKDRIFGMLESEWDQMGGAQNEAS